MLMAVVVTVFMLMTVLMVVTVSMLMAVLMVVIVLMFMAVLMTTRATLHLFVVFHCCLFLIECKVMSKKPQLGCILWQHGIAGSRKKKS